MAVSKIIGCTGSQNGATEKQLQEAYKLLAFLHSEGSLLFNHGDCIGVDAQLAEIAKQLGYKIIAHPPDIDKKRAFFASDTMLEPHTYLVRNQNIVDAVDLLIAVP